MVPASHPAGIAGLPPLGGRLFVAYRLACALLLAATLTVLLLSWFQASTHTAIWILRLFKAAVLIAVSAILIHRRRRDPVAAMLSLSFLLWAISSSVDFASAATMTVPALLDRCRFLLFALALLLFPDGQWVPRWTRLVAVAIVTVFLIGVVEALGLVPTSLFLPLAIGCVLLAIAALLGRFRAQASTMQRQQLKWVALGLVTGIFLILTARAGATVTANMEMPLVGAVVLEGLFQLGIVVIALGFLTSLLRYRLYDAETAISRSAVYAGLTLALVATFAACEALIELISQAYLGSGIGNVSGAVAAAVVAVLLTPLHGKISAWAENHFQRDLTILKKQLPDLLTALSASASVQRLGMAVLPRIEEAVHASRIALIVDGKLAAAQGISTASAKRLLHNWPTPQTVDRFDRNDDDPFPLRLPLRCPLGRVRGWLSLGPRPDGSFYGKDDVDALAEIAPPLQRTLFQVAAREIEAGHQRRAFNRVKRSVSAIGARLDRLERASQNY
jgi:hypothetical protein